MHFITLVSLWLDTCELWHYMMNFPLLFSWVICFKENEMETFQVTGILEIPLLGKENLE